MNINATLLVQAINFFIAYLLFRIILLNPAYQAISEDNAHHESLQEQIESNQGQLDEITKLQKKQWVQLHQFYTKNKPTLLEDRLFKPLPQTLKLAAPSAKEFSLIQENLTSLLVRQLGEVS